MRWWRSEGAINKGRNDMTHQSFQVGDVVVYTYSGNREVEEGTLGVIERVTAVSSLTLVEVRIGECQVCPLLFPDHWDVIDHLEECPMNATRTAIECGQCRKHSPGSEGWWRCFNQVIEKGAVSETKGCEGETKVAKPETMGVKNETEHVIGDGERVLRLERNNTVAVVLCKRCGHVIKEIDLTRVGIDFTI
jgi:hypothetical protein